MGLVDVACKMSHLQDGQFTFRRRAHVLAGLYIQISKKDLKYVTHMRTTVMFFVMLQQKSNHVSNACVDLCQTF